MNSEKTTKSINIYYDSKLSSHMILEKGHRTLVGGLWEEVGTLVADFLISEGLTPSSNILDIGCGCLRVGIPLIAFLEAGKYYGTDISSELLDIGYSKELKKAGLQYKLPRNQLIVDDNFGFQLPLLSFDYAIASSVFTHLPLNHIKLCLMRLSDIMSPGGKFYATFFLLSNNEQWDIPIKQTPGNIVTYPAMDPFHYSLSDLKFAITGLSWSLEVVDNWEHPRNQKMVLFTKK